MAGIKRSKQRDAIMNNLISRTDHPTAESIYISVRKEYPNISLGTVYRNLSLLVDMGHVIKVPCEDGSVHFDGRVMPHYHFQCICCKKIYDIELTDDLKNNEQSFLSSVNQVFEGDIEGSTSFFYGKCGVCKNTEDK